MTQVPEQFQQYFPGGLADGAVDWENVRKAAKKNMALSLWLNQNGYDVNSLAGAASAKRVARPGLEGDLAGVQKEYDDAPGIARTSAIEDAKRVGTYADEPNFMKGLDVEVGNRTKGIQTASKARIDELKKQLGYPS